MKNLTDAELMELLRQGDYHAFDELHRRYRRGVYNFLCRLTWDPDLAEDSVQEVFLRLYRARDRYQPTGKLSTYIFQIAKNLYLSQRRRERRRPGETSMEQVMCDGFRPFENLRASERVEPEAHLIEEYRVWRIRRAIEVLPEAQKLVFVMSHFEGMKYAEIAEVLAIPEGTVKSRMFHAVRMLKTLLKEEEP